MIVAALVVMGHLPPQRECAAWGAEALTSIRASLYLPERGLYADSRELDKPNPSGPAFMWGCGVQLSALAAAARIEPRTYKPQLRSYIDALDSYWATGNGIGGYDVLPVPKPLDRYYDDNAWMVLGFVEAFEVTRDSKDLERAEKAMAFVLSGEDEKGGGIFWHEQDRKFKGTCSNGPVVAGLLRLYERTHKPEYLESAKRIYAWVNAHLQDSDGLYFDGINLDGSIGKRKWSYNTALMIRSTCLLYDAMKRRRETGNGESYLREAERIARSAEKQWVKADSGGIDDDSQFAHLLCEAFVALYDRTHDRHWLDVARRAVTFVHDMVRDSNGHFGHNWATACPEPLQKFSLLDQASAARAFWVMAKYR